MKRKKAEGFGPVYYKGKIAPGFEGLGPTYEKDSKPVHMPKVNSNKKNPAPRKTTPSKRIPHKGKTWFV
jgi:hypothetical protein